MKFKNCFIDENGNVWHDSTLIKASAHLDTKLFWLKNIDLDEIIRWKLANVRDYVAHYRRVIKADCLIPIILRSDGYPMDGWHRIIKAIANGATNLPARQFIIDPDPDFKNLDRAQNANSSIK